MTEEEIKLKVKLEDIVWLAGRVKKLANEVYNLHLKIVNATEEEFDNGRPDARR